MFPFGHCQDINVIKSIARLATDPRSDRPYDPPKIIRIKITDPHHPAKKGNDRQEHRKRNDGPKEHAAESVTLPRLALVGRRTIREAPLPA